MRFKAFLLSALVAFAPFGAAARSPFDLVKEKPASAAALADWRAAAVKTLETEMDKRVKDLIARGATEAEAKAALEEALGRLKAAAPEELEMLEASPKLDALENRLFVLKELSALGNERFQKLLKMTNETPKTEFYQCLCAGGFLMGVSGGYHPEPTGDCKNAMPCKGGNWGCVSFDFPADAGTWARCGAANPGENGDLIAAIVARTLKARPIAEREPTEEECKAIRASADLGIFRDVPQEARIQALSPEAAERLNAVFNPAVFERIQSKVDEWMKAHPGMQPDELDIRTDLGLFEIGFGKDEKGRFSAKEIVLKVPEVAAGAGLDMGIGVKEEETDHAVKKYVWDGKLKFGFAFEGKQEWKFGIEGDNSKTASQYYDGEWQKESEYRLVRLIEDIVSRFDFYVGGATGVGTDKINIGTEYAIKIRDRYTDLIFSDMSAALDDLLENQKDWEAKRFSYVRDEAKRYGVDVRCLTTGQAIAAVHKAYEAQSITKPGLEAPFAKIRAHMEDRRKKAAAKP